MPCDLPQILNNAPTKWGLTRDREGHREYSVTFRVEGDRDLHGPYSILTETAGLYEPGSVWSELTTTDEWAYCTQEATVSLLGKQGENTLWEVGQVFTTKGQEDCPEDGIDDIILRKPRIRVETINYTKEAMFNADGTQIINSAFEGLRGPNVEFDDHKMRVYIEFYTADLDLDTFRGLMNFVNDDTLWGFPARHVKFSYFEATLLYRANCETFWHKKLVFDIGETDNGHDRVVLDEGTRVLRGKWDKDPASATYGTYVAADGVLATEPRDFIRYKDWNGENTRVILDGAGLPWDPDAPTEDTSIVVAYYPEGDLLLLGIPTDLENP